MKALEFETLLQDDALADMQDVYKQRQVAFGPGLDYAIGKATAGIRDPQAREIVSEVIRHLWTYLLDTLEQRLPQPKTRVGRWVRWVVGVL